MNNADPHLVQKLAAQCDADTQEALSQSGDPRLVRACSQTVEGLTARLASQHLLYPFGEDLAGVLEEISVQSLALDGAIPAACSEDYVDALLSKLADPEQCAGSLEIDSRPFLRALLKAMELGYEHLTELYIEADVDAPEALAQLWESGCVETLRVFGRDEEQLVARCQCLAQEGYAQGNDPVRSGLVRTYTA